MVSIRKSAIFAFLAFVVVVAVNAAFARNSTLDTLHNNVEVYPAEIVENYNGPVYPAEVVEVIYSSTPSPAENFTRSSATSTEMPSGHNTTDLY